MTDPRDIRMAEIDWQTILHDMGRSARPLWRLSRHDPNRKPEPYTNGCWSDLTLGDVADKGERDILRHLDVGPKALQRLREIIDMAIAGTLPLKGAPAPDSLWPRHREENGRFSGGSGDLSPDHRWFAALTHDREELVSILRALLAADEAGQGELWREAMERAAQFIKTEDDET